MGEIAIRTAANINGYWRNPKRPPQLFTADGYVRTGDVGYLDEDGYLFIVDRKKDIIIRGGENISAAEVEAACYACPPVAEVAVFGAPDERLGEVPIAVIHPKDGERLDEADLRMLPRRPARQVQDSGAHSSSRPSRCRASAPASSTGARLKAQYAL